MSKFAGSSLDEIYGPGQITGASEADFNGGNYRSPNAPTGQQNRGMTNDRYTQGSLEGTTMPMPLGNMGTASPDNFSGRPQQRLPQTQSADDIQASVFGSELVPNHDAAIRRRNTQTSCNRESLRGTLVIPAQTLAQYAETGNPMDIEILFDASGPFIGYNLTGTTIKGDVPLKPASLQREIYYKGQRYWSKWFNSDFANGSKKKYWIYILIAVVVCLLIAGGLYFLKKSNSGGTQDVAVQLKPKVEPKKLSTLADFESLI